MSLARTTFPFRRLQVLRPQAISRSTVRFASGDYGSGAGDPKGENPQEQGANPSADKEHPGPPPPKVGQNTGGATKAGAEGHNASQSTDTKPTKGNDPTQGKRTFSTFARAAFQNSKIVASEEKSGRELRSDKTKDAEPKILNEDSPSEAEQSGDVKKHNEEMDNRAEQAHEKAADKEGDKVGKGFWSGHGGADREP